MNLGDFIDSLEQHITAALGTELTVSAQLQGTDGVPMVANTAIVSVFPTATVNTPMRRAVVDSFMVSFSYSLPAAAPKTARKEWLRLEALLITEIESFRYGVWGEIDWANTTRSYAPPYAVSLITFTSTREVQNG